MTIEAVKAVAANIQSSKLLSEKSEILVVDNHSTDGTVDDLMRLRRSISFLKVLPQDHNVGFSQANNLAIEASSGKYVMLLNSDTIIQPKALENMVRTFINHPDRETTSVAAKHHDNLDHLGIVAAKLLNPDKTLQAQGGSFPTLLSLSVQMLMLDDIPVIGKFLPSTQHTGRNVRSSSSLFQQDWVGGTAMMVRREVFDDIGLLDGNIFMYGEDVEFCLRAKKHHWDIVIQPTAEVIHFGTASSSSLFALRGELKGYLYIWAKHKPHWQIPLLKKVIQTGCRLRTLLFDTISHNPKRAQMYRTLEKEIGRL
jgi:GT2 family glycosyltransferase